MHNNAFMNFFTDKEIEAVRGCFSTVTPLPDPAVERILQARITTKDYIDNWGGMRLEFYKDDRPHGRWEAYYANGQKWYEEIYKDGKKHKSEKWYRSGQKWYERNYQDGEKTKFESWYNNGQKMFVYNYKAGKKHGKCDAWHVNGHKWYEEHYNDGKLYEELYNDGIINKQAIL